MHEQARCLRLIIERRFKKDCLARMSLKKGPNYCSQRLCRKDTDSASGQSEAPASDQGRTAGGGAEGCCSGRGPDQRPDSHRQGGGLLWVLERQCPSGELAILHALWVFTGFVPLHICQTGYKQAGSLWAMVMQYISGLCFSLAYPTEVRQVRRVPDSEPIQGTRLQCCACLTAKLAHRKAAAHRKTGCPV